MMLYILIMLCIGIAVAYFGTLNDWFISNEYYGSYLCPFRTIGAILGVILWPSLILIVPIILAVWFANKNKQR